MIAPAITLVCRSCGETDLRVRFPKDRTRTQRVARICRDCKAQEIRRGKEKAGAYVSTRRTRVYGRIERVCHEEGCSAILGPRLRFCPEHRQARRAKWRARKSTNERGYDSRHRAMRAAWESTVALGLTKCPRCREAIAPGEPWDLDHTDDRLGYLGPAHRSCNRREAARKKNRLYPRRPR